MMPTYVYSQALQITAQNERGNKNNTHSPPLIFNCSPPVKLNNVEGYSSSLETEACIKFGKSPVKKSLIPSWFKKSFSFDDKNNNTITSRKRSSSQQKSLEETLPITTRQRSATASEVPLGFIRVGLNSPVSPRLNITNNGGSKPITIIRRPSTTSNFAVSANVNKTLESIKEEGSETVQKFFPLMSPDGRKISTHRKMNEFNFIATSCPDSGLGYYEQQRKFSTPASNISGEDNLVGSLDSQ